MKIAFIVENEFQSGGAFSQTLNTLNDIGKNFSYNKKILVFSKFKKNKKFFKKNDFLYFKNNFLDKVLIRINQIKILRKIIFNLGIKTSLESILIKKKVDLIFFPAPSILQFSIIKIKFISTIFDLCHLIKTPMSDISKQEFSLREKMNKYLAKKSCAVVTNSNILKEQIEKKYRLNKELIFTIPFIPKLKQKKFFYKKNFKYFFYPANFWKHKNHEVILKASKIILSMGLKNLQVIFTGFDKGNKKKIQEMIKNYGLEKKIIIKEFVSSRSLKSLYKNSSCLIMTTHYGPTNLPPLEAIFYNLPIIYNKKFRNEFDENCCYMVNVNNSKDLSKKMISLMKNKYKRKTLVNAKKFLDKKKEQNLNNIKKLDTFISSLKNN